MSLFEAISLAATSFLTGMSFAEWLRERAA